jgi:hypothetical protein
MLCYNMWESAPNPITRVRYMPIDVDHARRMHCHAIIQIRYQTLCRTALPGNNVLLAPTVGSSTCSSGDGETGGARHRTPGADRAELRAAIV